MGGHSKGKKPTPLPTFRYDWTGNDIRAIYALVDTVYGYVPRSLDVVDKLDSSVDALVHAAGWQGQAAENFKHTWEKDSAEAVGLTRLINSGGDILDTLAVKLAWIQNEWESLSPDPGKAHTMGRASAEPKIRQAVNTATQDLDSLSRGKLASAARQAIKDGTISADERKTLDNTLRVSLGSKSQKPGSRTSGPGLDDRILNSHTVKDLIGGATVGATVGGVIGGVVGIIGGPFAEITVPAGVAAGGAIGATVGGVAGGVWGLGEDLHIW